MSAFAAARASIYAAALLLIGPLVATVRAADVPAVVVVFDGSGSMWGNIEGSRQSKFVVARESLRRALANVGAQTRIGLAAFGHRRGDCLDVEVLRAPEPLDADKVMAPLERLNPRGKGPLTLALREAGKSLATTAGKRSLVLIHDDADNCAPDLCAAAAELRDAKLTVHVIGVGVKPEDVPKMACLTQATGGRSYNAQNADQVAAAVEEAMRLSSADPGISEPQRPAAPQAIEAPVRRAAPMQIPADGPPGLYLQALLAPNGEPVASPLHWIVLAEGRPEIAFFDATGTTPVIPAPPGRYVVEAHDGPVSVRQTVEVGDKGPTAVNLVLNAGTLRVRAHGQKAGETLADAMIAINEAGRSSESKKDPVGPTVAVFKGSEAVALIPAGRYVVRVELGLVRAERAVVVPAGSHGRIDIPVNAARVQLSAAAREGNNLLDAPIFSIAEDDPDAPRGRREIARSAAQQAEFVVPPGTYYVLVRQGNAEAREQLAVGPGELVKRTLWVSAGRLALSTRLVSGEQPSEEQVSYRVQRIDTSPPEVWATSRAAPVLLLPGGRYRVEGHYGGINVRAVREVEVKAGQTQQITLEHQVGALRLRLTGRAAPGDVYWEVRDETGRTVWTTGQSEPSGILQAGRYVVRAQTRDKWHERAVELRSGESKIIEVSAD